MQLIPHPMALPGCCFKCRTGSENREWFIDFEFSMDDFGAVIICNACVEEMAQGAGMITAAQATDYKEWHENALRELAEATIRIEGLEQAIDGLRLAGGSTRSYSLGDAPVFDAPAEPELPVGQVELDSGEGEITESLHDSGVAELSDDADSNGGQFTLNL